MTRHLVVLYACARCACSHVQIDTQIKYDLREQIYSKPAPHHEIAPQDILDPVFGAPSDTLVGQKVDSLRNGLYELQNDVAGLSGRLAALERDGQE